MEDLAVLKPDKYNGAVLLNSLYATADPLRCLRQLHDVLVPGATIGYSVTHSDTDLTELMEAILETVPSDDDAARADYEKLEACNRLIERTIARRYSREQYLNWTRMAGFEIIAHKDTYKNAVMLVHARK